MIVACSWCKTKIRLACPACMATAVSLPRLDLAICANSSCPVFSFDPADEGKPTATICPACTRKLLASKDTFDVPGLEPAGLR